ncbi:beta-lactamase family protein [Burkholderia sp. Ap-962]|uniref:serine hydrolase domain-containing protein n=1 Tax=Burkholderia sp. Ap-962 TaxID=2608333 RepID=UPI001421AC05|nr:serine hydrolase domain-containing protein [Burkholderia sp. Ap-962]NIF74949.1 beta-lactamase family protein [Burkholderia sp. Ap-962]
MTAASLDPTAFSLDAAPLAARLDAVFDQALRERRLVGAVAIVARHGEILYRRAQGLADREAGRPMREDTLFRLASVTKPIVALAVLRLVARGGNARHVAEELGVGERAVYQLFSAINRKLDSEHIRVSADKARQLGLLGDGYIAER